MRYRPGDPDDERGYRIALWVDTWMVPILAVAVVTVLWVMT